MSETKECVQNTKQSSQLFNYNTAENLKEDNVNINEDERDGKKSPEFSQIKMPPKILKQSRAKGAEVMVISLPRKKRRES